MSQTDRQLSSNEAFGGAALPTCEGPVSHALAGGVTVLKKCVCVSAP